MKHQPQRVGLTHELADEDISERRSSASRARGGQFDADVCQSPSSNADSPCAWIVNAGVWGDPVMRREGGGGGRSWRRRWRRNGGDPSGNVWQAEVEGYAFALTL